MREDDNLGYAGYCWLGGFFGRFIYFSSSSNLAFYCITYGDCFLTIMSVRCITANGFITGAEFLLSQSMLFIFSYTLTKKLCIDSNNWSIINFLIIKTTDYSQFLILYNSFSFVSEKKWINFQSYSNFL